MPIYVFTANSVARSIGYLTIVAPFLDTSEG